jgi:hypothetical protein
LNGECVLLSPRQHLRDLSSLRRLALPRSR